MTFEYELLHLKANLPLGVRPGLAEIGRRADACRIRAEQAEARLSEAEHNSEENAKLCASTMVKLAAERAKVAALEANCNIQAAACNNKISELRARLAAIDAAPVVAWQDVHDPSDLYWRRPDPAQVDTRELIARPAKD